MGNPVKPVVLITRRTPEPVLIQLEEECSTIVHDSESILPREEIMTKHREIDGLITVPTRIDEEFLEALPRLKVVSNLSAGYDNFDIDAMKKRQIIGTNSPDSGSESVADLVIGMMLAASRRIVELDAIVKRGEWTRPFPDSYMGNDVHHKTLGIFGMGRIGQLIARRAKMGFSMSVLYHNRTRIATLEEQLGVRYVEKDELLGASDFIVVQIPLARETRNFIGREEFQKMKQSAVLINASRGSVVDEYALAEALRTGRISSAAIDVYENEPVEKDSPLLLLPNVITLPHIGASTAESRLQLYRTAAANMIAALHGMVPPNRVV